MTRKTVFEFEVYDVALGSPLCKQKHHSIRVLLGDYFVSISFVTTVKRSITYTFVIMCIYSLDSPVVDFGQLLCSDLLAAD